MDHVPVPAVSSQRVTFVGPTSITLPFGARNIIGYRPWFSCAPVKLRQVFVAVWYTCGSGFTPTESVDLAGNHQHVAIRQGGQGRIPAPGIHVGHCGPAVRGRVVNAGLRKPHEVRYMAAGDEHPSIVQERVPRTEQVIADMGRDGDCLGDRVPHPLGVVAAKYQDLAVGHHDIVYGRLGKILQFRPLARDAGCAFATCGTLSPLAGAVCGTLPPLAGAVCGTLPPLAGAVCGTWRACAAPVGRRCGRIGAPTTGRQQGGCQKPHASNAPSRGHEVVHLELLAGMKPARSLFLTDP